MYQYIAERPLPRDNVTVELTARLAEKCAAIVDAHLKGHQLYDQHVRLVTTYLSRLAHEARNPHAVTACGTAALAAAIEAAPWPRSGPPKTQPSN